MKIVVPVIRKTEIGYRITTTFIYGELPQKTDQYITKTELGLKTAWQADLQIAARSIHAGHFAWKAAAAVTLLPVAIVGLTVLHVAAEAAVAGYRIAAEIISEVPDLVGSVAAALSNHAKKVVNPK